jgi:NADPH-dependent 2,4-dienoyl-CoA reductase/sulfur reductase-like enzyme
LENVYTFRGIDDAKKVDAGKVSNIYCNFISFLLSAAQKGKRVVVIGSSFISMELVVAISKRELASIDVIGLEEFPFQTVLGKEIGASLKKVLPLFLHF